MCGRFALPMDVSEIVEAFTTRPPPNDFQVASPAYNICPTQTIAVIRSEDGERKVSAMRWGFLPHWYKHEGDGPLLINARAETIAEKPAFKSSCRERRCIIPAAGFYEWRAEAPKAPKIPFYIHPKQDGALLAFAGIWRSWGEKDGDSIETCAIVTCAANERLTPLHHRMPVILAEQDWPLWLGEGDKIGAATLMRPADEDLLVYHEVSRAVSSARSEGPQLIEPVEPERTLL